MVLGLLLSGCAEEISENPVNIKNSFGPNFDFKCYNSCKDRNYEDLCIKRCTLE
jgi:hypothetical protein